MYIELFYTVAIKLTLEKYVKTLLGIRKTLTDSF